MPHNKKIKTGHREIRHSPEFFRTAVEAAPNAMIVVESHARITMVNAAAERMFGYTREELIGEEIELLLPEAIRLKHVGFRDEFMKNPSTRSMGAGRDLLGRRKDGSEVPVEIGLNPIHVPGGGVLVLASIVDISARLKLAAASENIVEAAPNAMIVIDSTGKITLVNGAAVSMFGYEREAMIGQKVELLLPEAVQQRHVALRDEFLKNPTTRSMGAGRELFGRRRDGSEVPVEIGLNPVRTPEGISILASIVDITERLKAAREKGELEERVRHSQKLESLGVLAGGIAHDFNNLLSVILGNAELALMHVPPGSPAAKHLDRIFSTARRAAELSRQMLAYSGRGRFEVKQINLSHVVREISELLKVSVSKKAKVRLEFASELPEIDADAAQVNQVIMNLITNANESLEDKPGEIVLRTGLQRIDHTFLKECIADPEVQPGPFVFFEVQDSGCGMNEATRKRIFEPFFTTKFTGRGLGLSAVLGIVRAHHGAMHVRSSPGNGTSMRVLFPAKASESAGQARSTPSNGVWRAKGIALIADDEEFVRAVTRSQLESFGLQVIEASDGEEAVRAFDEHGPKLALAVLDLTMPRLDGDKAASYMLSKRPNLPLIIASGYSAQEVSQRVREYPHVVMLPKPASLADLQFAVQRALNQ